MKRAILLLGALSLVLPSSAFAWGEKGHYIVSEAATLSLPTDMPHFFYQAFPDLVWLAYDPDRWRAGAASLDAENPPNHYLDYEFVSHLELPPSRYAYLALMHDSGLLRRLGIENTDPGFLPWKIAEVTQTLEVMFREWRRAHPSEREMVERDIIHFAGVLGHYVGDSANPHHNTIHYNGWLGVGNPKGYAIDCGTHSRFETTFVSHAVDVGQVTAKVTATPARSTDYFATALANVRASNALVETLYTLDRDGAFHPLGKPREAGVAFATDRLATGAAFLRDLWWSAWVNSGEKRER